MTDPIERAKAHAATSYPEAEVITRSVRGQAIVLASEGNLIRIVRLTDLDAQPGDEAQASSRKNSPRDGRRT